MSDEQPTSWRERFFGSTPTADAAPSTDEQPADASQTDHDSAELAPDDAEVAATSVEEHDAHQPLVEHDTDADTAVLDTTADRGAAADDADDRAADSPIEPTVIAPSTLRGPSHSAAHPDDATRATADEVHGEAATSSLENPETDAPAEAAEPPALVEPRRPSFGLRRRAGDDRAEAGATDDDALGSEQDRADDQGAGTGAGTGVAAGGLAAAVAGGAAASAGTRADDDRSTQSPAFEEPAPTQAIDAQRADDDATRAIDAQQADTGAQTRVLDAQDDSAQRTERFGVIRDEVPASSIAVDDETARAAASGGTPIVLVEEPLPPRRKGARGVGFAVALLATLVFAIVFAAAHFAVGYLFDRAFDAAALLESVWLLPSFLLPVIMFFLAYWIITLVVNRAGWWAHVLGGFIVALLVYVAHIAGAYMEQQGGWAAYTQLGGIDAQSLGQLLLAPLSVLAFVVAREVPVWVGGLVARRGRKARDWNRQALDEFNAENSERLAAYERARG